MPLKSATQKRLIALAECGRASKKTKIIHEENDNVMVDFEQLCMQRPSYHSQIVDLVHRIERLAKENDALRAENDVYKNEERERMYAIRHIDTTKEEKPSAPFRLVYLNYFIQFVTKTRCPHCNHPPYVRPAAYQTHLEKKHGKR